MGVCCFIKWKCLIFKWLKVGSLRIVFYKKNEYIKILKIKVKNKIKKILFYFFNKMFNYFLFWELINICIREYFLFNFNVDKIKY